MANIQVEARKLDNVHFLYLVRLTNENETFLKIGITSVTIEERMSYITNYDYELIDYIECDGHQARSFESILLEKVLDYNGKYQPKKKNGWVLRVLLR